MTEIDAIRESLAMWEWLHQNPLKHKMQYLLFKSLEIYEIKSFCACCEYYICKNCPLNKGRSCADGNYYKWFGSMYYARGRFFKRKYKVKSKEASGEIVRMLKVKLNELLNELLIKGA